GHAPNGAEAFARWRPQCWWCRNPGGCDETILSRSGTHSGPRHPARQRLARRILLVPVPSERSAAPQELAEACRRANPRAQVIECASLGEALEKTIEDGFVTIGGSLYLIGEAVGVT